MRMKTSVNPLCSAALFVQASDIDKPYYQQGALGFRELIRFDAPLDWNILDPVVGWKVISADLPIN